MPYLDINELKQLNVIDEIKNATAEDNVRLQYLLDYCTHLIDSYIGYSFVYEPNKTIFVDGEGTNQIALPTRIMNIRSVQTTDGYVYDKNTLHIVGTHNNKILSLRDKFPDGCYNIIVNADFGWERVPKEVIDCLVMLCNGRYESITDSETLSKASGPFKSETIGDYRYEIRSNIDAHTGGLIETTGNAEVDRILKKYIMKNDVFIGVI